jgi:hypothetical protein
MLSFFSNSERDKKITVLKNQMQSLKDAFSAWENSSIIQILSDRIGKIELEIENINLFQDMVDDRMVDFDDRLKKMESLLNVPIKPLYVENINQLTTVEAIIEFLNTSKKEFHLDDIFVNVKNYNIKNKDVTKNTVKASLYSLVNQGRIQYGEKASTFKRSD